MPRPLLEPGVTYAKLPPTTLIKDLTPGDRLIYSGRTYEVLTPTTFTPSGKKYIQQWRLVNYVARTYQWGGNNGYLKNYINKSFRQSGLVKTATQRVVYRPEEFFPHYIEEY